jgi:hypothetical protein
MSVIIDGSASVTINSGAILGITSGTAVASTSSTSIDFTALPSWIKKITVMLSGVSVNSTSNFLIQIGSSSITSTGYASRASFFQGATLSGSNSSAGFIAANYAAANTTSGAITLTLLTSNTWVATGYLADSGSNASATGGTSPALGGVLDRVRITTVSGTDTFDAGSINILYEG